MFVRAKRWLLALILFGVTPATGGSPAGAQDLEPRAFAPAPVGMNFALVGYGYAAGSMLFDSALPAEDVEGTVHSASVGYLRTLVHRFGRRRLQPLYAINGEAEVTEEILEHLAGFRGELPRRLQDLDYLVSSRRITHPRASCPFRV